MKQGLFTRSKLFALVLALMVASFVPPPAAEAQIATTRDASVAFVKEVTFAASSARTTSSNSGNPVDTAAYASGVILINVTAASGTSPTLVVNFENCLDATTTKCGTHTATASLTTTGFTVIKVNQFSRYTRVSWTVGGTTPSFTFEVYGAFKPTT